MLGVLETVVSPQRLNEATRAEWRNLGFFYDREDTSRTWRIVGSVTGIRKFARKVREYALNPRNETLSEHQHFGPYMYLEIGTALRPEITDHWIAGPLQSLADLATLIDQAAERAQIGDSISLRQAFAPESTYDLVIEVRHEAFDPAREDPHCW